MLMRIRSIKPEVHLDEDLWDAEQETGMPLFRAFVALWSAADREGRFRWRPRALKALCLPYWDGDFSRVLAALEEREFVQRYQVGTREYGLVRTFARHQAVNARERASELPAPPDGDTCERAIDACPTRAPRVDDASMTRAPRVNSLHVHARGEGNGRERELEGNGNGPARARARESFAGPGPSAALAAPESGVWELSPPSSPSLPPSWLDDAPHPAEGDDLGETSDSPDELAGPVTELDAAALGTPPRAETPPRAGGDLEASAPPPPSPAPAGRPPLTWQRVGGLYAVRYTRETTRPLALHLHQAAFEAVLLESGGDEAAVTKSLERYFADEWAIQHRWPPSAWAKQFGRHLDGPQATASEREEQRVRSAREEQARIERYYAEQWEQCQREIAQRKPRDWASTPIAPEDREVWLSMSRSLGLAVPGA